MLIMEIRKLIQYSVHHVISFYDFMNACLYQPKRGYYVSDREKIGRAGDFYTSSSIGTIMGEAVVRSLIEKTAKHGIVNWVEWGAGQGRLALHILNALQEQNPGMYDQITYIMVEASPYHQKQQRRLLKDHAAHIRILSPNEGALSLPRRCIMVGNELLDAFPVHRIRKENDTVYEIGVTWNEEKGGFCETLLPLNHPEILSYLRTQRIELRNGQSAEINLDALRWLETQLNHMEEGELLLLDYGDTAEEIYAPHRMQGTLMCYYRHTAADSPYVHIGDQDMTAHVNFSALQRLAKHMGVEVCTLETQKQFLLSSGIFEMLQNHAGRDPFSPQARRNRSIRQLLLSDGMSELFKVLHITKKAIGS